MSIIASQINRTFRNSIFSTLFLTSVSTATIIHVPQDHTTIQVGIDTAVNGDTVLVDTGRYGENVNHSDKNELEFVGR